MNFSACRSCPARAQIGNQIWQTPPIPVVPDRLCRSVSADQRSWPSEVHSKVWLPPLSNPFPISYGTVRFWSRSQVMDDPSTLRRKAAHFFENAASATTPEEAEKLKEVGRQLELWADDLEKVETRREKPKLGDEARKR